MSDQLKVTSRRKPMFEPQPFALSHSVTGLGMGYRFCQTKTVPCVGGPNNFLQGDYIILAFSCTTSRTSPALVNAFIFNSVFCIFRMTE